MVIKSPLIVMKPPFYNAMKPVNIPVCIQYGIQGPMKKKIDIAWSNVNRLQCAGLSNEHFIEKVLLRIQFS